MVIHFVPLGSDNSEVTQIFTSRFTNFESRHATYDAVFPFPRIGYDGEEYSCEKAVYSPTTNDLDTLQCVTR